MTCTTEGFSHFVTSMTAPVASGWSGCRGGLHPLESTAFSRRTRQADIANHEKSSSLKEKGPHEAAQQDASQSGSGD
jgi:hypothetical protein